MRSHRLLRSCALTAGLALAAAAAIPGAAHGAGRTPGTDVAPTAAAPSALPDPFAHLPRVPSLHLTSTSISNGRPLPRAQLSGIYRVPGGRDISPELSWSGYPARTRAFVITFFDPQAPFLGGAYQWVVANIPAITHRLAVGAGSPHSPSLPRGASDITNGLGVTRYIGGAPLPGTGVHDYLFTVSAVDVSHVTVGRTTGAAQIAFDLYEHTVARASIACPTSAAEAGLH